MPLCRLLEIQGAGTLRLPAIEIKALGNRRDMAARLGPFENFDVIIFTSANAVRFGASLLDQKRDLTLAAVGARPPPAPSTKPAIGWRCSRRKRRFGRPAPASAAGTSGRPPHTAHQGQPRPPLSGAGTHEPRRPGVGREVYERVPTTPGRAVLDSLLQSFAAGAVQVITATSVEIAANLLRIAGPALRDEFERAHWLVPGERVAAAVRGLGLKAPLLPAGSAEDQDLVAALIRWRSSVSGA